MKRLLVSHPNRIISSQIVLPASKSIANRLLILDAVYPGKLQVENIPASDDTKVLQHALEINSGTVNVNNAGTAFRFLLAYYASRPCDIILHGNERLHQRPVSVLVDALRSLGADIDYINQDGFAPLRIRGKILKGRKVSLDISQSSQFASALMLIAPSLPNGLTITIKGKKVSETYIQMTERIMADCGILSDINRNTIDIPPQKVKNGIHKVEPDWSAASYWYTLALLSEKAEIQLTGLNPSYLQGDMAIAEYLKYGVSTSYNETGTFLSKLESNSEPVLLNLANEPDLFPAIAVAFAVTNKEASLQGLSHLQYKESNRIVAICNELNKCGFNTTSTNSSALIQSSSPDFDMVPEIETYGDHRIAMAFATLSLKFKAICIQDPDVVEKSYPHFWEDLKLAGFQLKNI